MVKDMRKIVSMICVFAMVIAIPTVIGGQSVVNKTVVNPPGNTDWWSMTRHDLSSKGVSLGQGPQTNNLGWSQNYQDVDSFASGPIVVNDKIYAFTVQSGDMPRGGVYCFNAIDGSIIWSDTNAALAILGGIYNNNRIYSVGLSSTFMGVILCHDANTGELIWSYTLIASAFSMPSFPVYYNGKIFFTWEDLDLQHACLMVHLRCLKDCGNFALSMWDKTLAPDNRASSYYSVYAIPAIVNGNIYALTEHMIYKYNAETGTKYWEENRSKLTYLTLAEQNGKIAFGEGNNVTYIDSSAGQVLWSQAVNPNVWAIMSPAVISDKIYVEFITKNHTIHVSCLKNTGQIMWTKQIDTYSSGDYYMFSPSIAGDKLYIGGGVYGSSGKVFCLSTSTGNMLWNHSLDDGGRQSVSIADNALYIASFGGTLYRFKDLSQNGAPSTPVITGPASGDVGTTYNYSFVSTDPNQDYVYYFINWSDVTESGWIGPYQSGVPIIRSHSWSEEGTYIIKAKAKDFNGTESDWGTLSVIMPLTKPQEIPSQYDALRTLNIRAVIEMMKK